MSTSGHLLTAAHVLQQRPSSHVEVLVRCVDSNQLEWMPMHVVYDASSPIGLDVAVLQCAAPERICWTQHRSVVVATSSPVHGQAVYGIGYPHNPHKMDRQTAYESRVVTGGMLSKIVRDQQSQDGMIRTSASILNGQSGGVLINNTGLAIGLIISSTKAEEATHPIAKLNACLPLWPLLRPVWNTLEHHGHEPQEVLAAMMDHRLHQQLSTASIPAVWRIQSDVALATNRLRSAL